MTTDDNFLSTEEVQDYLQIDQRTVYRLIHAGKLAAFRIGRQWRFQKEDLDAWLATRRLEATNRPTPPSQRKAEKARILVIDDEQPVRELLARTLREASYEVDTANDGPTALERLRAKGFDYDLLITDLKMPGMDGLSVIRAVRRQNLDLPVIVITGFSTEASAIEAINLGVSGYITKPFRVPRILSVAARALGVPLRAVEA